MVWLEQRQVWNSNGNVCKYGKEFIVDGFLEQEVVGKLMDRQENRLVGGGTDHIRGDDELPAGERGFPKKIRHGELEQNHANDIPLGFGFVSGELGHLGVSF